jgi:hypothetical protein
MHGFLVSTLFKAIRNEHSDLCATEDWVSFLWRWGKTTNLVDVAASDISMTHCAKCIPIANAPQESASFVTSGLIRSNVGLHGNTGNFCTSSAHSSLFIFVQNKATTLHI